jgi:hypothetical protein
MAKNTGSEARQFLFTMRRAAHIERARFFSFWGGWGCWSFFVPSVFSLCSNQDLNGFPTCSSSSL